MNINGEIPSAPIAPEPEERIERIEHIPTAAGDGNVKEPIHVSSTISSPNIPKKSCVTTKDRETVSLADFDIKSVTSIATTGDCKAKNRTHVSNIILSPNFPKKMTVQSRPRSVGPAASESKNEQFKCESFYKLRNPKLKSERGKGEVLANRKTKTKTKK